LLVIATPLVGNPNFEVRTIRSGDTLSKLFGRPDRVEFVARINGLEPRRLIPGHTYYVPRDWALLETFTPFPAMVDSLATVSHAAFIDLSEQFLGAYERGTLVQFCPVATGTPDHPTRTGTYTVRWRDADHVSNLYFDDEGNGLPMHWGVNIGGATWIHEGNLRHRPASHGCIRMRHDDAKWFFQWAPRGSPVCIVP
jgi:hypothetical protein